MSAVEEPAAGDEALGAFPQFELCCLFDDDLDPRILTVFPQHPEDDLTTEWISIDADHAVPLERVR